MIPTGFGIAIAAIGLVLLATSGVATMFGFVIFCGLLGGAAAVSLPALGGSSILPVHFALLFLLLRILLPGSGQGQFVRDALRANLWLATFILYGVAIAWAGPRLFAGEIAVVPMKYTGDGMFVTTPLAPSSQNITAAVYLLGTLACAIGSYVACRNPGGQRALVGVGVAVCFLHVFFGLSDVLLSGTGYEAFLDLFRNGSYAQLDQHIGTVSRMNGIFPEPSSFAAFGLVWFVFLFECWFRDVAPRTTGPASVALGLTLMLSTSSTAYLGLAIYTLLFALRTMLLPLHVPSAKLVRIALGLMATATVICAVMLAKPNLYAWMSGILKDMTIGKQNSSSAIQRTFWAQQGWSAFLASSGLGVGPGSFRSSSQFMALLGATGLIGAIAFAGHVLIVLKPLRASTYGLVASRSDAIGVAAAWSAVCLLLAAGFISPSPDPGSDFALMAGASLALRGRRNSREHPEITLPMELRMPLDGVFNGQRRLHSPAPLFGPATRLPPPALREARE